MFGIYVHFPFCRKKCPFCDFAVTTRTQSMDAYMDRLMMDIEHHAPFWQSFSPIDSVFFGGGTPSLMQASWIERILEKLSRHLNMHADVEVTLECNPEDITYAHVMDLLGVGITRFSVGAQATQDHVLNALGRNHTRKHVLDAAETLQKANAGNVSFDLIFGVPGQSLQDWQTCLEQVCGFDLKHISTYELTVEPNTLLHRNVRQGKVVMPQDDLIASMFSLAKSTLNQEGFDTYEVSNACKPGFESRHNLSCWRGDAYWGIGMSAFSRRIKDHEVCYIVQPKTFTEYMHPKSRAPLPSIEYVSPRTFAQDQMMTGLRLSQGIKKSTWDQWMHALGGDVQKRALDLTHQGWLQNDHEYVRVSDHARIVTDAVVSQLWS